MRVCRCRGADVSDDPHHHGNCAVDGHHRHDADHAVRGHHHGKSGAACHHHFEDDGDGHHHGNCAVEHHHPGEDGAACHRHLPEGGGDGHHRRDADHAVHDHRHPEGDAACHHHHADVSDHRRLDGMNRHVRTPHLGLHRKPILCRNRPVRRRIRRGRCRNRPVRCPSRIHAPVHCRFRARNHPGGHCHDPMMSFRGVQT